MELENQISAESIPPTLHVDEREHELFDPEVETDTQLKHDFSNPDADHERATHDFVPSEMSAPAHHHHGEHESVERELKAAQERITKLQVDLADAEKKLADNQEGLSAASKQAEDFKKEMERQEKLAKEVSEECTRLKSAVEVAEVRAREAEQMVKNLEGEPEDNQTLLEEMKAEKGKTEGEHGLMREKVAQLEGQLADEKTQAADLERELQNSELKIKELEGSAFAAEESKVALEEQLSTLEETLKGTQDELKAKEDALQAEVNSLNSKISELLATSEENLKVLEEEHQKQIKGSEEKCEALQKSLLELEEKNGSLIAADEDARKKLSDVELELDSLRHIQGDLEEKFRISEEKCSQHESNVETFRTRGVELEGLISEHRTKADDACSKVESLEAALLDTQNTASDLEMKLQQAKMSSEHTAELERYTKDNETKIAELQEACASAKSNEEHTKEVLLSTEKVLEETRTELYRASQRNSELELSVEAMESELKGSLSREKLGTGERATLEASIAKLEGERGDLESEVQQHASLLEKGMADLHKASAQEVMLREEISTLQEAKTVLQDLLSEIENEKQSTITQLDSAQKSFAELSDKLVHEREQLQQKISTVFEENEVLNQKFASAQETLRSTLAAAELSSKQVQESSLKESTLSSQIEDLNLQLRKALDACAQVESLEQENGNLAQKFASIQEKLDGSIEAAEASARELQEALSKESTLSAEIEDLKAQLEKAMDACAQVEKLEKTSEISITAEEHQRQMDQVLATSKLAESRIAELEEELSKSNLEIKRGQKAFTEQDIHVKEPVNVGSESVEVFDQPPEFAKTREIELDLQSPGKLKNRKKKGVTWEADGQATWEADGEAAAMVKSVDKPTVQLPGHKFLSYTSVAILGILIGFWISKEVDL